MTADAAVLIARARRDQPLVVALAKALSLAANVEVPLVRRIRRVLVRQADVRVEAELWASKLVEFRGTAELRLRGDVQREFWDELGEDLPALEKIWTALTAARTRARPLLVLEERLTYLAIRGDDEAIEEALGGVLRAMLGEGDRRRDLAAWSARALARLPDVVRETEAARVLATVARSWVATPVQVAELTPSPEGARLASRMMKAGPTLPAHLRLLRNMLVVGGERKEPCVTIEVSAGAPSIIVDEDTVVPVDPRKSVEVIGVNPGATVGTLDGRRWRLNRVAPRPDLLAIGVLHGLQQARVASPIAPMLAVTSAQNIGEGVRFIGVRLAGEVVSGQLVALDREADIALLEVPHAMPSRRLTLGGQPRRGAPCQVYLLMDEPSGESWLAPGDWLGPLNGTVVSESTLRLSDEDIPWHLFRPGLPVFQDMHVLGLVRGVSQEGVVSMTPARTIQLWEERMHALGPTVEQEARRLAAFPMVLRLPAWVALDGMLGKQIVREGPTQRFRCHQWGDHVITVVVGLADARGPRGAIPVEVKVVEGGIAQGELVAFMPPPEGQGFEARLYAAARRAMQRYLTGDVGLVGDTTKMIEIRIRRLPGLPFEFAVRRGVRYLIETLAELAKPELPRTLLVHAPGVNKYDLMPLHDRWQDAALPYEVVSIDRDADLLEVRGGGPDFEAVLGSALEALGTPIAHVYSPADPRDRLAGQFGGSRIRSGYTLTVKRIGGRAIVEVASTEGRPVQGYVALYAFQGDWQMISYRVRATAGVFRVEMPAPDRRSTIGAIVEDDGVPLEAVLAAPNAWVSAVARISGRGTGATGFLVAKHLVLTTISPPDRESRLRELIEQTVSISLLGEASRRESRIVDFDEEAGWALLRLEEPCLVDPVRLGRLAPGREYTAEIVGFDRFAAGREHRAESEPIHVQGTLDYFGRRPHLRAELTTAAAGAPIVVDGRVVAMVSEPSQSGAVRYIDHVTVVSMEAVVERNPSLMTWDDVGTD